MTTGRPEIEIMWKIRTFVLTAVYMIIHLKLLEPETEAGMIKQNLTNLMLSKIIVWDAGLGPGPNP